MRDKDTFLDKVHQHLFSLETEGDNFLPSEQDMLLRYRAVFAKWLSDWHLSDREMVRWLMKDYQIGKIQAYQDIRAVKTLLGNVQQAGKEFQRYRATEMVLRAYGLATTAQTRQEIFRAEAMIKAAVAMTKIHKLSINEAEPLPFGEIVPASFETTGDVSVLGLQPIPNLRELQEKLRARYLGADKAQIIDISPMPMNVREDEG